MELLLGCGADRKKRIAVKGKPDWAHLITLDIEPNHNPDIVHDLNTRPLPFDDNQFDEIHAYETLEHIGQQGDWRGFFEEWNEYYRILKPSGYFCGTCPRYDNVWAWADPGHTRLIAPQTLIFLSQAAYAERVGSTSMSDYRSVYRGDFVIIWQEMGETSASFVLQAIK